jgi:hypothetical protein
MNRHVILGIAVAAAFAVGVLSANPVVEAAGGWKAAVDDLKAAITDLRETEILGFYKINKPLNGVVGSSVFCDEGDIATGGGGRSLDHSLKQSFPTGDPGDPPNGWQIVATGEVTSIQVICADYAPEHEP